MRLRSAIWMSLSVAWLLLTGCQPTSPYLREVKPAYDAAGKPMPEYYTIPKPFVQHMLKDLKACYKEADR